jgi:Na+/H+-dicarboxylate symporter
MRRFDLTAVALKQKRAVRHACQSMVEIFFKVTVVMVVCAPYANVFAGFYQAVDQTDRLVYGLEVHD